MPSCRLLCLLLLPLLAVSASDDPEEDYVPQSKSSESHILSDPLSLPPDGRLMDGRLNLPRGWATLFDRLSSESSDQVRTSGDANAQTKRVFCNGFTGCGGRSRGRRSGPDGKSSESHILSDPLSLPPDGRLMDGRLNLPRALATLFDRLSSESSNQVRTPGNTDGLTKRVFCNGFTGCGGRFRGRRRQHPPVLGKRPFCNYFGCGNAGKRSEAPTKAVAQRVMRLPDDIRKRLFCNSFDGCRGRKRALYSNWLSKLQGIADDL
ncbi:uncharacterized protein [Haliotis cracherodii]|uniref:uncharacterized protein n=1 Tax=Haliotis cracherodii TaxID=6455 RepID=UPI0039EBCDDE